MEDNESNTPETVEESVIETVESFTQEQVNAIAAKAAAKAKRQAKREFEMSKVQTEETTTAVEQQSPPAWASAMLNKISTLESKIATKERESDFAVAIGGVNDIDADEKALLRLSFESDRELFDRKLAKLKSQHMPPGPKGEGFKGIGSPTQVPSADMESDPRAWDADTVARYRKEGTFLKRLEDYKQKLPGGSGGLFPAKNPKPGG